MTTSYLIFYRLFSFLILIFSLFVITVSSTSAATISNAKDTITTSRPSASAPLSADQAAAATQVTIYDNGSVFLASDAATFRADTGETQNTVIVASMSAANIPSANRRTLYLVTGPANTHHNGDAVISPVTAMHTISFTVPSAIPASGKILMTFPGSGDTSASPSASTFAFNGLTSANAAANISYRLDGSATCTFTVTAPTIQCAPSAGIAAGTTITFLIGCADTATDATTCTAQAPRLINPTKGASAGTADIWKIAVRTQDSNSIDVDSGTVAVGTVETVQVQATVDSTFTFSIAGIGNGTAANTGNTTGCTNTESTNTGIASSANSVNLGVLSSSYLSIAAQLISISTNGQNGYSLTATSSGHLINPSSGFFIDDEVTPAVFPAAGPWFGIHACGLNVNTTTWGTAGSTTTRGSGAKYGWPTQTTAVTLASASTGPIGNTAATGGVGSGLTTVEYAAGIDVSVPAGLYYSTITYVATPTF